MNVSGAVRTHGRSSSAFSTVNTLMFSAIPTVSVAMMVALVQRFRLTSLSAKRTSCARF